MKNNSPVVSTQVPINHTLIQPDQHNRDFLQTFDSNRIIGGK